MATNEEIQQGISELSIKIDDYYDFVQKIYKGNSDLLSGLEKDVLLLDGTVLPNLKKALALFEVDKTNAVALLEQLVEDFGLEKQDLLNSLNQIINQFELDKNNALESLSQTELSKLTADVREVEKLTYTTKRIQDIGVAGKPGFGLGDPMPDEVPEGFVRKMTGNYVDKSGSWMNYYPISKMRIGHPDSPMYSVYGVNTIEVANLTEEEKATYKNKPYVSDADFSLGDGWMIPIHNVDNGVFLDGVWFDKYFGGLEGGILKSKAGLDPVHSHTDGQYGPRFSEVLVDGVSAGANRLDTAYMAVKSRGEEYCVPENAFASYLFYVTIAQSQNAISSADVAWIDVEPKLPKGNNNSLKDIDDPSVVYQQARKQTGKARCGAIENFEKTTHDGSILGTADMNGFMWLICSGFTRTTALGFLTRKRDFKLSDLTPTTAFDVDKYNPVNVGAVIAGNSGWISLGNGENAVFDNDLESIQKIFNGIPKADGVSANGTNLFGKDGLYRAIVHELVPLRCGIWDITFQSGLGAMGLGSARSGSGFSMGVRAYRCQYAKSL